MTMRTVDGDPFYRAYDRSGQGVRLKSKHVRQYEIDFVRRSGWHSGLSVLELGCGNGLFLRFLEQAGAADFLGVDGDSRVIEEIPEGLRARVVIADFKAFFAGCQRRFDRVVLFDVLEHFAPADAAALLSAIADVLAPGGKVVIRVPNMGSPFGLGVQYNDVTHQSAFTPGSLAQVARAAGYPLPDFHPQAYSSRWRELREALLTRTLSWFLAAPPMIWSPNMIAVLCRR